MLNRLHKQRGGESVKAQNASLDSDMCQMAISAQCEVRILNIYIYIYTTQTHKKGQESTRSITQNHEDLVGIWDSSYRACFQPQKKSFCFFLVAFYTGKTGELVERTG